MYKYCDSMHIFQVLWITLWVVDCSYVGKGITAPKYLSRYLYRSVISENNIVSNQNGQIRIRTLMKYITF